ncbi:MAG: hypothetical protein ACJ739_02335 [Acidimicrobiales bacterium]
MTATTVSPSLPANAWNSLLKLAIGLTFALVMIAGSFAVGRSTADDTSTVVHKVVSPAATGSAYDLPPVGLHTGAAAASSPVLAGAAYDQPPVSLHSGVADAAIVPAVTVGCSPSAHTPPC